MSAGTLLVSGLGLIGGSLAGAATAAGWRVLLHHHRPGPAAQAAARGWGEAIGDLAAASAADLAIVCTPVEHLAANIRLIAAAIPAVLSDVGSVKGALGAELADLGRRFVGSHPMCGSHLQGLANADPAIFRAATTIITALPGAEAAAVALVERLWTSLGCRLVHLDPASHDRAVASASHLPHLLANVAARQLGPESAPLGAGGFRDVTRIAGASPELWAGILLANRVEAAAAARRAGADLVELATALERGDGSAVSAWLAAGRAGRRRYEQAQVR